MRALSREEQALFDEMKERCLAKGQYKDEKAKDKFKMLCHLEDFMIQYWELLKENERLKIQISAREEVCNRLEDNWNKLRDYFNERIEVCDNRLSSPFCNFEKVTKERLIFSQCLEKLEELEQGSDSNEI